MVQQSRVLQTIGIVSMVVSLMVLTGCVSQAPVADDGDAQQTPGVVVEKIDDTDDKDDDDKDTDDKDTDDKDTDDKDDDDKDDDDKDDDDKDDENKANPRTTTKQVAQQPTKKPAAHHKNDDDDGNEEVEDIMKLLTDELDIEEDDD